MNNRDRLIEIMTERGLDRSEMAQLLSVKKKDIDQWLLSNESADHKEIPDMAIELLQYKLDL
jgi:plasmid maintenance system antidote protein VapI|tara:strand:- start:1703 stop:1888 length:186 start_codon:yes stop_codon:yes gene_type:complete